MEANIDPRFQAFSAPRLLCMFLPVAANGSSAFGATLARARRAAHAKRAQRAFWTPSVFDGPPPEVQREMVAAARAGETLAAEGKELRFGRSADGRVSVELTDTSGHPLDVIGPSGLFQLLDQDD
jgi:hypothetical protein